MQCITDQMFTCGAIACVVIINCLVAITAGAIHTGVEITLIIELTVEPWDKNN